MKFDQLKGRLMEDSELRDRQTKIGVYWVEYRFCGCTSFLDVFVGFRSTNHLQTIKLVVNREFNGTATVLRVKEKPVNKRFGCAGIGTPQSRRDK